MLCYAKIENGIVIEKVVGVNKSGLDGWFEMPIELGYYGGNIYYSDGKFHTENHSELLSNEDIKFKFGLLTNENERLKQQLEIAQAVLDELLFGGVE